MQKALLRDRIKFEWEKQKTFLRAKEMGDKFIQASYYLAGLIIFFLLVFLVFSSR